MTTDNYIVTLSWMNDLGLSLVEKTVYAIIYGFSQDGVSAFSGSRQYLADWCECSSLRTIDAALNKLVDRKLIVKKIEVVNNMRYCSYVADCTGRAKIAQGGAQNCTGGRANFAHNNIDNNAEDKSSANRENIHARARVSHNVFDFVGKLVDAGVDPKTASDWADTRKKAGATNSETQLADIVKQFDRAAQLYGMTPQDCVECAEANSWRGFRATWEKVKTFADERNASRRGAGRAPRYTGDTI